jgi:hypothetical protein
VAWVWARGYGVRGTARGEPRRDSHVLLPKPSHLVTSYRKRPIARAREAESDNG